MLDKIRFEEHQLAERSQDFCHKRFSFFIYRKLASFYKETIDSLVLQSCSCIQQTIPLIFSVRRHSLLSSSCSGPFQFSEAIIRFTHTHFQFDRDIFPSSRSLYPSIYRILQLFIQVSLSDAHRISHSRYLVKILNWHIPPRRDHTRSNADCEIISENSFCFGYSLFVTAHIQ